MEFRRRPDTDDGSPSERVILAVAEQTNTDPVELPPLYHTIDPEALDAFLATWEDGLIEFQYAGHSVSIECDGTIHLTEDTGSPAPRTD